MRTSSAMLLGTLLPAAFAAFTSALSPPGGRSFSACEVITEELQKMLRPLDPHTYPSISDSIYDHGDTSLQLNFNDAVISGFSDIGCEAFGINPDGITMLLTLQGSKVEYFSNCSTAEGFLHGERFSLTSPASLQVSDYEITLTSDLDSYSWDPLSLCVLASEWVFSAESMVVKFDFSAELSQKLNDDSMALVNALHTYHQRLGFPLAALLNQTLCKTF